MAAPVVRVGAVDCVIDPGLAAAVVALQNGGLLDGAELVDLAPNEPAAHRHEQERAAS